MGVEVLDGSTIVSFVEDEAAFNGSICDLFDRLDEDRDGLLSYAEMLKELQSLRVTEADFGFDFKTDPHELDLIYGSMFLQFDRDSNGKIDLEEFKAETKRMLLAVATGLGFLPVQMALEEDSFLMKAVQRESNNKVAEDKRGIVFGILGNPFPMEANFGVDSKDPHKLDHVYGSHFVQFNCDSNGKVDLEEFKAETKGSGFSVKEGTSAVRFGFHG